MAAASADELTSCRAEVVDLDALDVGALDVDALDVDALDVDALTDAVPGDGSFQW